MEISNEKLREKLIEIEKDYVGKYFKNFIEEETKQDPDNIEDRKRFIKRIFVVSIYKLVGGRAKIESVEEGFNSFSEFIDKKLDERQISDYSYFSKKLKEFTKEKEKTFTIKDIECIEDSNFKDISNLTAFKCMGQKTAALFLRFLCCYTNFFKKNKPNNLLVPLDRVNWRFCCDLFGENDERFIEKEKNDKDGGNFNFNNKKFKDFQNLALEVMKNPEDRIYFDNLWFIGHFWHDRRYTYLFSLSDGDITENDSERIKKYLYEELGIDWAKDAEIKKSDNCESLIVTKGERSHTFKIKKDEKKNDKLKIYRDNECKVSEVVKEIDTNYLKGIKKKLPPQCPLYDFCPKND